MDPITLTIVGLAIAGASFGAAIGGPAIKARLKRRRSRKALYKTVLKKSSDLQPEEVMGELRGSTKGGFRDYCLDRDEIDQIKKRIAAGKDVLVIGDPLAGKSRAVYEALKHAENPPAVTIPRIVDVNPNEFKVPLHLSGIRRGVLLVDDINKYVSKQHFELLLQQYIDNGYLIVATCRSGPELKGAESALEQIFASLFNDPVEMGKVDRGEAVAVAKATGDEMPEQYDGNIGSIFIPIEAMRQRYTEECTDEGRAMLRSIKRLFMGGVYKEGGVYSEGHIKEVSEELEELKLEKFKWKSVLDSLTDLSFLRPGKEGIAVEETYIEQIFKVDCSLLDNFRELADLFSDDPDALFKVGNRAGNTQYSKELGDGFVEVKRLAVNVHKSVLDHWTRRSSPIAHARTLVHLSLAYRKLGGIEDKAVNCKGAIDSCSEALMVYTLERMPINHALTQNSLGLALHQLADVDDKAANCKRAITAHHHSLIVFTRERTPSQYAATHNNLGNAYSTIAEVEDKQGNCKLGIAAYWQALKVYNLERFPKDYAGVQNNLGNAYSVLAEVEDKAVNCKKAISAFQESLRFLTLDHFPLNYAMTQNNLGATYNVLSSVEHASANSKRAIAAFQEALEVCTLDRFPMDHAMTQNNLGNTYGDLAILENGAVNFSLAIAAYFEALKVYTLEHYPMDYSMTQNNLGITFSQLAMFTDFSGNCKRAIAAYQEALKVRTLERFPIQYATTQNNLGAAYDTLAEVEDKAANCKEAREAYEAALAVYRRLNMPLQVQGVEGNLARLDAFEAEE